MNNYQVYVISKTGKALMPTKRCGRVRKLLKSGQAKVLRGKPFTIQLLYETEEHTQRLIMGIDPGGEKIGSTVRTELGKIVYAEEITTRSREVSENMKERRMYRQSRRRHRRKKKQRRAKREKKYFIEKKYKISGTEKELECKYIKPKKIRFNNRHREEKWLTPTARHLLESHKKCVRNIKKKLPISEVCLEYGKFDIHKLKKPEVTGKEYQNGRKKGYANSQEYVLCRDQHTCQLCKKSEVKLQVHHVIWQSEGGDDSPENLVTLCAKCHEKVHKKPKIDEEVKKMFTGITKRYVHTTLLNSIMPDFKRWLEEEVAEVSITYGYETKEKRRTLDLPKSHHIDAYVISFGEEEKIPEQEWEQVKVYQVKEFRRHHRQIIHAMRDRNYKEGKKIVAKNRRQKTGQQTDSLKELVEKKGRDVLTDLRVLPGKKVKRSGFNKIRKGDVVRYKGKCYVVKGYGEMGRRIGFCQEKQYVPAEQCQLIVRNTGRVCL